MKKITMLAVVALFLASFTYLVKEKFPSMECIDVNDKVVKIPAAGVGKYTILGLAYSQKAEDDLKTWYGPLYNKFIRVPEKKPMFWEPYNVNLYFIPLFSGVKQAAAGQFQKEVKKNVEPSLQPHILMYKGKIDDYVSTLSMKDKNIPYFFLLDKEGNIVYKASGAFTQTKLTQMEQKIQDFE